MIRALSSRALAIRFASWSVGQSVETIVGVVVGVIHQSRLVQFRQELFRGFEIGGLAVEFKLLQFGSAHNDVKLAVRFVSVNVKFREIRNCGLIGLWRKLNPIVEHVGTRTIKLAGPIVEERLKIPAAEIIIKLELGVVVDPHHRNIIR